MSLPANFPVVSTAPLPLSGDHLQSLSPAERKKALAQQANWSAEKRPGESHVIRHRAVPFDKPLLERPDPLAISVYDLFAHGVRDFPQYPCLGWRHPDGGPYSWKSFLEVHDDIQIAGSALINRCGLTSGNRSMVGLYANNCPQWTTIDLACAGYDMVTATMYPTFEDKAIEYIVTLCEIPVVFAQRANVPRLFKIGSNLPSLKHVIVMDDVVSGADREQAGSLGWNIMGWEEFMSHGAPRVPLCPPKDPKALYSLCFTSGTTGTPKGVMLSHVGMTAIAAAIKVVFPSDYYKAGVDIHVSYLPLAHIFERSALLVMLYCGTAIGYFRGDNLKLMDDLQELKPTFFNAVPRVIGRIVDTVQNTVDAKAVVKFLFNRAYASKAGTLEKTGAVSKDTLADKVIFNKIQAVTGGRVKNMISGAAPISPKSLEFLRVVFGTNVHEGYGATETAAALSITSNGDVWLPFGSHVGPPLPCNEVKLVDVPDMKYLSTDKPYPRGEICCRGPNVMLGYYKEPQKTAEALDDQGYYHTGDIGVILPNGTIKIVDRVKHLFKLAQGEYVAPEKVEVTYVRSKYVAQAFVYGDSLQRHLVAIIVPDQEQLMLWAKANNLGNLSFAELCANKKVEAMILKDLAAVAKENQLPGFEQAKHIHLTPEMFTAENGLLTPTFKSKRNELKAHFQKEIKELYSRL